MFNHRAIHIASYAVIIAAAVFVLLIAWMLIWPITPGTTIESITVPASAKQGETINAKIDYCKSVSGEATSNYTLVTSGQVIYLPPIVTNRPLGCDTAIVEIIIPVTAPLGKAHYELDVTRQYNPIHQDTVSGESNDFTILPAG